VTILADAQAAPGDRRRRGIGRETVDCMFASSHIFAKVPPVTSVNPDPSEEAPARPAP
jgi:hypothetical protein